MTAVVRQAPRRRRRDPIVRWIDSVTARLLDGTLDPADALARAAEIERAVERLRSAAAERLDSSLSDADIAWMFGISRRAVAARRRR